jgi:arylsulfatase A-like enzyme
MTRITRREALCGIGVASFGLAAEKSLHFVFILIDDLGWADPGCYGSRFHETPNIDRLAGQGMRFTSAYAAACQGSPTRVSILTGKYLARLHLTADLPDDAPPKPEQKFLSPRMPPGLPLGEVTLAEVLKPAGYVSAAIGKWRLGPEAFDPNRQGFEFTFGASGSLAGNLTDEAIRFISVGSNEGNSGFVVGSLRHLQVLGIPREAEDHGRPRADRAGAK